jgi:hypothetical protein
MPFSSATDPQQLAMLNAALEEFCRVGIIRAGTVEHIEAGRLIMSLYSKGATTAKALSEALENPSPRRRPTLSPAS